MKFLRFARFVWRDLAFCGVLLGFRTACEIVGVFALSPLVTELAGGKTQALTPLLITMAVAQVGVLTAAYARPWFEARLSNRLMTRLRAALYDHLQHMAFSFYDEVPSGKLTGRLLKDLETIGGYVRQSAVAGVEVLLTILAYAALLFFRSVWLFAAILVIIPAWSYLLAVFTRRVTLVYREQDNAYSDMIAAANENIRGRATVRALNADGREKTRYDDLALRLLERTKKVVAFNAFFSPLFGGVAMVAHVSLVAICGALIWFGRLPVGDLVILGAAMSGILTRLEQISQITAATPSALEALKRVFGLLDLKTVLDEPGPALTARPGVLRVEGVTFGYGAARPVLQDVHAEFPVGSVTALVGPTGSGKTTLALLLGRFYAPTAGRITLDEIDLADLSVDSLRHHVGYVFQETFLFTGSVRDNIRYGRMDVSDEMVLHAAKIAHADEFIVGLPHGYDTPLGEKGVQLSGGQRQRLALARALVYDPPVLVLDDATAALDASTDAIVRQNLRDAFRGRTVVMITHKRASLALADRILRLGEGRVAPTEARALEGELG